MTEYIVLGKHNEDWVESGKVTAPSAKAAIREILSVDGKAEGEFVAVPARSWQPVKVQVETALKFST